MQNLEISKKLTSWQLVETNARLELRHGNNKFGNAIYVDFVNKKAKRRYQQQLITHELLAKAVGIKSNYRPSVYDLSAGLGRDAYLLYSCGCKISLVERSPIIAALLSDGLKRANCQMPLYIGEARDFLLRCQHSSEKNPDVIYFDPIFPESKKFALAKKESQVLREIVGEDLDAKEVFDLAISIAVKRVVIKRPRLAPNIDHKVKPDLKFIGNSIRFDVYLRA